MLAINFPSSAAWNEAIRPAIETNSSAADFAKILDSIAIQLTNPNISPNQVAFSSSTNATTTSTKKKSGSKNDNNDDENNNNDNNIEKSTLVNVGARIVLESILAGFVPGTSEESIKELLMTKSSSRVSSMGIVGEPLQSEEHAAAAAAIWMKYGKKMVNAQRSRSIDEICQRVLLSSPSSTTTNEKDDDANILRYLSSEVRVCTRSAGGDDDESSEGSETTTNRDNLFQPFGNFALAAENCEQQRQQGGSNNQQQGTTMLQLSSNQTYDFLCEIDAIQKKLDELRG